MTGSYREECDKLFRVLEGNAPQPQTRDQVTVSMQPVDGDRLVDDLASLARSRWAIGAFRLTRGGVASIVVANAWH